MLCISVCVCMHAVCLAPRRLDSREAIAVVGSLTKVTFTSTLQFSLSSQFMKWAKGSSFCSVLQLRICVYATQMTRNDKSAALSKPC